MEKPRSDHFNGSTFHLPHGNFRRSLLDVLRWRLTSWPARWPRQVPLAAQTPPPRPRDGEIVATWLGHATALVQTNAGNVLFDPVFSERVGPGGWIGPRRAHPPPLSADALPPLEAVCISHDHYDHFDAPSLRALARRTDLVFIGPLRAGDLLSSVGARRIVELDWWQSHRLPSGIEVTLTPTRHWSRRIGTPRNHRLWGGYFLHVPDGPAGAMTNPRSDENGAGSARGGAPWPPANRPGREDSGSTGIRRVWFVGDTGFQEHFFRRVREQLGAPDLAFVPIGAYEPRWFMHPMHVNPAEAVMLHQEVGARTSIAIHWGTFRLTNEAREEPVRALGEALAAAGVPPERFRVLQPGESLIAPKPTGAPADPRKEGVPRDAGD